MTFLKSTRRDKPRALRSQKASLPDKSSEETFHCLFTTAYMVAAYHGSFRKRSMLKVFFHLEWVCYDGASYPYASSSHNSGCFVKSLWQGSVGFDAGSHRTPCVVNPTFKY